MKQNDTWYDYLEHFCYLLARGYMLARVFMVYYVNSGRIIEVVVFFSQIGTRLGRARRIIHLHIHHHKLARSKYEVLWTCR